MRSIRGLVGVLSLLLISASSSGAEPLLHHGDYLAMAGDSITYMSRYSLYVETYLLATRPDLDLRVMKIQRWCGGTADNYARETLEQELIPAKPNIATICFGMNDGGGREFDRDTEQRYEGALSQIAERARASGITTLICSPGVVDAFSYHNPELTDRLLNTPGGPTTNPTSAGVQIASVVYNGTLASLADVGRRVADKYQMPFADVHDAMMTVMQAAIPAYGTAWPPRVSLRWPDRAALVCDDGIHPDTAAHIPMAYAVLRALRFDGDIGHINFDWPGGRAETDAAQTASVSVKGRIELTSTRLPMCFFDDTACSEGYPSVPCRYVLQHCPFHQDLNRYVLRVHGLPNQPVRVTWGDRSLVFTREQLEAGINLAAEFPDNPFCPALHALDAAIWRKQVYERSLFAILNIPVWEMHFAGSKPEDRRRMLDESLTEFARWAGHEFADKPDLLARFADIRMRALQDPASIHPQELSDVRRILFERDETYMRQVKELVKPVHHTIEIHPLP